MHTVFVNAIHQDGRIQSIWGHDYEKFEEAQSCGFRDAREAILCDPEFHSVRAYQVVIPSSSGNYSRFFTLAHSIEEVVF